MGGSIHIHGTGSSIVDTVFVCRDLVERQEVLPFNRLQAIIEVELSQLQAAGMRPTQGDIRCITFGHLTRLAILTLYPEWDDELPMSEKLALFGRVTDGLGDHASLIARLVGGLPAVTKNKNTQLPETVAHAAAL
jgi:hypothetical protein